MAPQLPAELTPPRPRRRLEVAAADGTRLSVEIHGPEVAPTVLLAHGWTCRASFWAPVVRRLRIDLRVVVYDQRGHGYSDRPRAAGFTPEALADDMAAVIDATVGPLRRAVVVGHSMGAMTLVAMSHRHPDVLQRGVAAALLASTGVDELSGRLDLISLPGQLAGLVPDPVLRTVQFLTRGGLADARLLRTLPIAMARSAVRHITLSPSATAAQTAFCTDIIRSCPPTTHHEFAKLLHRLDLSDEVDWLTVPALVVVGTEDRLTPAWHAHRLAEALPHSLGVVEVPYVGHMTPVQAPDMINTSVQLLVEDYLSGPSDAQRRAVG
jgi:pimeloyl-ACP methyl ester carboxylesterase